MIYIDVADKIKAIDGYLCDGQEELLYNLAKAVHDNGSILEIGCYKGRSTTAIAYGCYGTNKRITVIDIFYPDQGPYGHSQKDLEGVLQKNNLLELVTILKGHSSLILKQFPEEKMFDLSFIDGSHEYADVLNDFDEVYKHTHPDGIIALHDVTPGWKDCARVWEERKNLLHDHGSCGSLAYGKK